MALPTATGYPDYTAAGTNKFTPELWSPKLVSKFYETTVFGEIASTDYEGEITNHGDKVIIRTRPSITVNKYTKGQDLSYENPESPAVELLIDQGEYFAFTIDNVDKYQSDLGLIDEWSDDASEQMKIAIDTEILTSIYSDVHADNTGANAGTKSSMFDLGAAGAAIGLTKENILDYIVDLGTVLDEQNVPDDGRWLVLPAWACGLIKKSDLKDASLSGDETSIMRNGRIGMIDRFRIYKSNLLDSTTETEGEAFHMVAGHRAGLTFASQMTEMEDLPNPNQFGTLIRGLQVYGYEVIEPKYLAQLYAYKG